MTASREDIVLASDLAALGADCRHELRPAASAGVYRDDRPGAEARRDALLDQRRRELAVMPLELSHVFVHRVGRAAAGGAALVFATMMFVVVANPLVIRMASWAMPGLRGLTLLDIPLCVAVVAAGVLLVHVVATSIAERVFARRMRRAVATTGDAYLDLDRLAEGPIEVGRRLIRRVDGWAIGLPVAGITALVSLFGFIAVVVEAAPRRPVFRFMPDPGPIDVVGANIQFVAVGVAIAVGLAAVLGLFCNREHARGELPGWARLLGHWVTVPIAFIIGMSALYGARISETMPDHAARISLALSGVVAVFAPVTWALLALRRREHARIDAGC